MAAKIEKKKRVYFPEELKPEKWDDLETVLGEMLEARIESSEDLIKFIEKYSELSDVLEDIGARKYVKMTQFADKPEFAEDQMNFYEHIAAPSQPYFFKLDKKIYESEFFKDLPRERYEHLGKIIRNEIELFRQENIPLFIKENELANKYGEIYSGLTVEFEGKEKTLKEMDLVLKDKDRKRREEAWRLVAGKMLEKREEFEKLFDELKVLRVQIAKNAGFENYRDYMHKAYGRFDYTPNDIFEFHNAIEIVVLPALRKINEKRKEKMGVGELRPWDMSVDLDGKILKPFSSIQELLDGALRILGRMDSGFADVARTMSENELLDLPNRKGKAPGGYSYSFNEIGYAFIFMNAVGLHYDVSTLMHEFGHALHAFMKREEKISQYKSSPYEVNEVSSMSMELFLLCFLDEFYKENEDIKKAKREHLEEVLFVFPLVSSVDLFQHWVYMNPESCADERDEKFAQIKERFSSGVDWFGLEREKGIGWVGTRHIFESPFYYIEYAIAQLGAIALYKHFKENPHKTIEDYKKFMKLGYSKSVPEIYASAGIKFDFSKEYMKEMVDFVMGEIEGLE